MRLVTSIILVEAVKTTLAPMSKEYAIAHSELNWSMEKIIQSNLNAIEHAFTTNEKKEKLRKHLKSFS